MTKTLLTILLTTMMIVLASPAQAASKPDPSFFGMHVPGISEGAYPDTVGITSVRLWDTYTSWRDVEVSRNEYNWTRLDEAVRNAESHNDSVMLVLGGTPEFYAKDPSSPSIYGAGFGSEVNDLGAWKNYVRAVATRYKGRITAYEPWNEGDITAFYNGSESHLITLARIAYQTIKSVDSNATVTSPSFVDRLASSQWEIMSYLKHGGAEYADAVSYHPYGMPEYGPEQNAGLVTSLRAKMVAKNIHLPVWATEINYALPFGDFKGPAIVYSEWQQAAFMSRTFILQNNAHVKRVYWYAWSDAEFLGVKMMSAGTKTPAANALETVKYWLRAPVDTCSVSKAGTYTCRVRYSGRDGFIRWNPTHTVYPKAPNNTLTKHNMYGRLLSYSRQVGSAPVLYR